MQQQLSRDWLTDITEHAPIVIHLKQAVSIERTKFAHPIVSEEYLDRFLNIGARSQNLTDLELRLFHYFFLSHFVDVDMTTLGEDQD